jgi:hypothetical protein
MFEIGTLVRKDAPESSTNGMVGVVVERMPFKTINVRARHPDNPYCYRVQWNSIDRIEVGPFWIFPHLLKLANL